MPSSKSKLKPKPETLPVPEHEWSFEAIGTAWWIGIYEPVEPAQLAQLKLAIADRIEIFDKNYSRFRDDSLVTAIASKAGDYDMPEDAAELIAFYWQLYEISDGLVTPLVGKVLSDAGYDSTYSLKSGKLQIAPAWEKSMTYKDGHLSTTKPLLLDFGAAGKGYLVDIVAGILKKAGLTRFCVDAGGDMYAQGFEEPLVIGLENPDDVSEAIGVKRLYKGALCGSSGNRRAWPGYNHIIDPRKLASPKHIRAVWTQAASAMLADGLSTALYFVPAVKLRQKFDFEYLILGSDGNLEGSADFAAELFGKASSNA